MNKNTGIIIGVVAIVVIVGGVYASMKSKDDAMMVKEQMEKKTMEEKKMIEEKAMMEKKAMEDKDAMMKKEDPSMMKKDAMLKAGSYEAYSPDKVAMASSLHHVVLFFRAGWCPTCRAVDADIKANLAKIPSSLTILDVNYDNSTALKQKYGVTYQHTFVQVDKDGNLIKKWSGSPTLSALVAEVK